MTAAGTEADWTPEPLGQHHDRSAFACGSPALDQYLRRQAGQDARRRLAAPFVVCAPGTNQVIGYYTLSAISVDVGDLPQETARRLSGYPQIPTILLGRLARDAHVWLQHRHVHARIAADAYADLGWVVAEVVKSYWHNGRRAPLYYYRDRDKREIDLLIVQDGTIYPLEIKKTASPRPETVRHFSVLDRLDLPKGPGGVICLAESYLPLTETAQCIPVSAL